MNSAPLTLETLAVRVTALEHTAKALADTFAKVAESEHGHVNAFHDQVVRLIKEKEAKGEKAPEGMRLLYDREHKRQIEMAAKIKSMSALYRGN